MGLLRLTLADCGERAHNVTQTEVLIDTLEPMFWPCARTNQIARAEEVKRSNENKRKPANTCELSAVLNGVGRTARQAGNKIRQITTHF